MKVRGFYFYSMIFKVGARVAYLNSTGEGRVIEIRGDEVLVEDENGFSDWFHVSELVRRSGFEVGDVRVKDVSSRPKHSAGRMPPNQMVVDLHFDQLVDYPKNFTAFEKLEIQLREAKKAVEKCKKAGIKKLILIHGVGEGRLKEEVHMMLERLDRLRFYDASLAEYGRGATEVEFF